VFALFNTVTPALTAFPFGVLFEFAFAVIPYPVPPVPLVKDSSVPVWHFPQPSFHKQVEAVAPCGDPECG
jgi:hypothetical protein